MDIATYTRGYQYGMFHAGKVSASTRGRIEIQDFDEKAEIMAQNGEHGDYIDGFIDGCEQKLNDISNGVQVSLETQ